MFIFKTILLAAAWLLFTRNATLGNVGTGLVLGLSIAAIRMDEADARSRPRLALGPLFSLLGVFLLRMAQSTVRVAFDLLRPNLNDHLDIAIIAIPVELQDDLAIAMFSNLITLTPGSAGIHFDEKGRKLYMHSFYARDPEDEVRRLKNDFEKPLLRIFPNP